VTTTHCDGWMRSRHGRTLAVNGKVLVDGTWTLREDCAAMAMTRGAVRARAKAAAQAKLDARAARRTALPPPAHRSRPPSGGRYPGYTGPRCYPPGGRTWHPC
jgi:hypothetical protein